jgi:hypothetical protein
MKPDDPAEETADPFAVVPSGPARSEGMLRRVVLGALIGMAIGVACTIVVLRSLNRDPTPELTPAIFHDQHARAKAAAPADYDVEVRVTGSQPATYRVQVRGGQAQAAWRNGQPLTSRRTFGTWSIPGMLSTISRDIDVIERRAAGKADPLLPRLTLRAQFDPTYHYPAKYRRIEWGSPVEVAWEVTAFNAQPVLSDPTAKRSAESYSASAK